MNAKVNKVFFCILILITWTPKYQYYRAQRRHYWKICNSCIGFSALPFFSATIQVTKASQLLRLINLGRRHVPIGRAFKIVG